MRTHSLSALLSLQGIQFRVSLTDKHMKLINLVFMLNKIKRKTSFIMIMLCAAVSGIIFACVPYVSCQDNTFCSREFLEQMLSLVKYLINLILSFLGHQILYISLIWANFRIWFRVVSYSCSLKVYWFSILYWSGSQHGHNLDQPWIDTLSDQAYVFLWKFRICHVAFSQSITRDIWS